MDSVAERCALGFAFVTTCAFVLLECVSYVAVSMSRSACGVMGFPVSLVFCERFAWLLMPCDVDVAASLRVLFARVRMFTGCEQTGRRSCCVLMARG